MPYDTWGGRHNVGSFRLRLWYTCVSSLIHGEYLANSRFQNFLKFQWHCTLKNILQFTLSRFCLKITGFPVGILSEGLRSSLLQVYGGSARMDFLQTLFPGMDTKYSLATAEELQPFAGKASQLAAIDYHVSLRSDIFLSASRGNMHNSLVSSPWHYSANIFLIRTDFLLKWLCMFLLSTGSASYIPEREEDNQTRYESDGPTFFERKLNMARVQEKCAWRPQKQDGPSHLAAAHSIYLHVPSTRLHVHCQTLDCWNQRQHLDRCNHLFGHSSSNAWSQSNSFAWNQSNSIAWSQSNCETVIEPSLKIPSDPLLG